MFVRIGFTSLALLGVFAASTVAFSTLPKDRYLTIRYIEEGDTLKIIADQTLAVRNDEAFDFFSGGESQTIPDESKLNFGTEITGKLITVDVHSCRISLKLKIGNLVRNENSSTQIVQSEGLEVQTLLEVGKLVNLPCGGKRRLELNLDN